MKTPSPATLAPLLVSTEQAAAVLGVNRRTLYRLLETGDLSAVRVRHRRLIHVDELRRFAETGTGA